MILMGCEVEKVIRVFKTLYASNPAKVKEG
jgi:hypothetical protein